MQVVFQDPYGSLNPRMTVGKIISEPLKIHFSLTRAEIRERLDELLSMVGLAPEHAGRYPHEFSGGQRQRIGIARAIALNPKFIILDEPVSALDVSIQGQILNLLIDLQEKFSLTYLFVAHDLAVVEHMSERIVVMYLGRVVEENTREGLYQAPLHPYTKLLISSLPKVGVTYTQKKLTGIPGNPPLLLTPPTGCRFRERCPVAFEKCLEEPPFVEIGKNHSIACWREAAPNA